MIVLNLKTNLNTNIPNEIYTNIEKVKTRTYWDDLNDDVVFTWPNVYFGDSEYPWCEPLFETIHLMLDKDYNLFYLGYGLDQGTHACDHIHHEIYRISENYNELMDLSLAYRIGKNLSNYQRQKPDFAEIKKFMEFQIDLFEKHWLSYRKKLLNG